MTIEIDLGTVLSVLWHHHFLAFRAIGSSSIFFDDIHRYLIGGGEGTD